MRRVLFFLLFALCVGTAGMSNAALISFDSFNDYDNINGINLGGVTITALDGIVEVHANSRDHLGYVSPYNCITPSSLDAGKQLLLTFDIPIDYVSIVGGDACADTDRFSMKAYDSSWNCLGMADTGVFRGLDSSNPLNTTFRDYRTLTLDVSGVKYVVLEQVTWGVGWDNLEFNPVPIPGAIWLLGSGLIGLIGLRRRRGVKVVAARIKRGPCYPELQEEV